MVLYSPGFGMERTAGTALVQDLAAHGYVVVTVDHTHDAQLVEFPDGRIATHAVPPGAFAAALDVRVADIRFVLDRLTAMSRGHHPHAPGRALPRGLLQVLLPQAGTPAAEREPMIGSIDGERSVAIQRVYLRAFLDRHLRHRDGRLLAGPSARYPEVLFLP